MLSYTAGVIRRPRAQIGSCWRKLSPAQQALVVAYLRKGETFEGGPLPGLRGHFQAPTCLRDATASITESDQ